MLQLEEVWTVFNPGDTHGATNDMAKENLNDLIEYIKTLSIGESLQDKDSIRRCLPTHVPEHIG